MFNAGTLTFEEFAMREQLPLATIHDAVLEFLRGRGTLFYSEHRLLMLMSVSRA